jgi:hypothetical protein
MDEKENGIKKNTLQSAKALTKAEMKLMGKR